MKLVHVIVNMVSVLSDVRKNILKENSIQRSWKEKKNASKELSFRIQDYVLSEFIILNRTRSSFVEFQYYLCSYRFRLKLQ